MILKSLKLQNFRSYKDTDFEFGKITIIVGPNGIGKTNILEAILLLSTTKSHRAKKDSEMIAWGQDLARLHVETDVGPLQLVITKTGKLAKERGVQRRLSEFLGAMKTILFYPEEIGAIAGSPALRRRILDMVLCQIDRKYTHDLLEYQKIIHQRNELLLAIKMNRAHADELYFWDRTLAKIGARIEEKRLTSLTFINSKIGKIYQNFSEDKNNLQIKYEPTFPLDGKISQGFIAALDRARDREIRFAQTMIGPHRSDLIFMLDDKPLAQFGSRGELRSALFAFKVALEELIVQDSGQKPILLLDDVFSELDAKRRRALSRALLGLQTIITTTDIKNLDKEFVEKAKIIELK